MTTAKIQIRGAVPSDARQLNRYIRRIYSTSNHLVTKPGEFRTSTFRQRFWIAGKASNPFETCLVAVSDGTIIGMLDSWTDRRARVKHVTTFAMSVDPKHTRQGIGKALLNKFINWVAENPRLERIELHVHADNAAAIALYEKTGFTVEGTRKRAIKYDDNRFIDDILMASWPNSSSVETR